MLCGLMSNVLVVWKKNSLPFISKIYGKRVSK